MSCLVMPLLVMSCPVMLILVMLRLVMSLPGYAITRLCCYAVVSLSGPGHCRTVMHSITCLLCNSRYINCWPTESGQTTLLEINLFEFL